MRVVADRHTIGFTAVRLPADVGVVLTLAAGLVPFAAADWLLSRYRRARHEKQEVPPAL